MSTSEALTRIQGTIEFQSYPASEGTIAWKPEEALERLRRAAVNFTGLSFPFVAKTDVRGERRPHRINEGYEASFVWWHTGRPRMEYWQVHQNGFFGVRRDLPELDGEQRLESLSMYRTLYAIASSLQVTASLYTDAMDDNDDIVWRCEARGLKGRYLAIESGPTSGVDDSHQCNSETYGPKELVRPLHLIRASAKELASEVMADVCSFFDAPLEPTHFVERVEELFTRFPGTRW